MALRKLALTGMALCAAALLGCSHDRGGSSGAAEMTAPPLADSPAFGLHYNDQGEQVSLSYGEANSDNVALMMECAKGSGAVEISDQVRASRSALVLSSGGARNALPARVEDGEDGPQVLVADTLADTPSLQAFRRSGALVVGDGGTAYGVKASAPERAEVDLFFTACGLRT